MLTHIIGYATKSVLDGNQRDDSMKALANLRKIMNDAVKQILIYKKIVDELIPTGSVMPRLYGLPKIHKPDIPLRPVNVRCSSVG